MRLARGKRWSDRRSTWSVSSALTRDVERSYRARAGGTVTSINGMSNKKDTASGNTHRETKYMIVAVCKDRLIIVLGKVETTSQLNVL